MGKEDLASNRGSSGEYWLRQSEVVELAAVHRGAPAE